MNEFQSNALRGVLLHTLKASRLANGAVAFRFYDLASRVTRRKNCENVMLQKYIPDEFDSAHGMHHLRERVRGAARAARQYPLCRGAARVLCQRPKRRCEVPKHDSRLGDPLLTFKNVKIPGFDRNRDLDANRNRVGGHKTIRSLTSDV